MMAMEQEFIEINQINDFFTFLWSVSKLHILIRIFSNLPSKLMHKFFNVLFYFLSVTNNWFLNIIINCICVRFVLNAFIS